MKEQKMLEEVKGRELNTGKEATQGGKALQCFEGPSRRKLENLEKAEGC